MSSPETIQLRTEHSRSVDQAEKYQALQTLTELGLLIPLEEVESYHGRLRTPDQTAGWSVDPAFANGGNDSGNSNVNDRPTLYTGEKEVAEGFARNRWQQAVRSSYMAEFEDEVRAYGPEQRQEWLDRLNGELKGQWDGFDPEYQATHPFQPLQPDSLGNWHSVFREAHRLEAATPDEAKRLRWQRHAQGYTAEVHNIASADKDAAVMDFDFSASKLDEADKQRFDAALAALALPLTEGSPVSFEARHDTEAFVEVAKQVATTLYTEADVTALAQKAGISEELSRHMCGAFNARQMFLNNPVYLAHRLLKVPSDMVIAQIKLGEDTEAQDVPLNLEYAQRVLREAHIVGARQGVDSVTLGKVVTSVSFFDLERVNTTERLTAERLATTERLGAIAGRLAIPEADGGTATLVKLLHDPHAKPAKLVAAMKGIAGYREIMESDAGNWEGFTLEQHVETVLRNFDENFADRLPVDLLAPLRLAILAHDLGKPAAVAKGQKHMEREHNLAQASSFFSEIGLPAQTADFLNSILDQGVQLAYQAEISGMKESGRRLRALARRSLQHLKGDGETVTEQDIEGYVGLCNVILACDGGAYTSMAVTSRPGKGNFRNAPSFNASFAHPVGLGKRGLKLAGPGDAKAAPDLSPKI